jgi:hypothetical protein
MVRLLSNAAEYVHASARKRQTSSVQTTYRGPTTEALHRREPQKSTCRLRDSIKIIWDTVLGGPVRVHELAHRTIDLFGVQADRIHSYQKGRWNFDAVKEGFRLPCGILHMPTALRNRSHTRHIFDVARFRVNTCCANFNVSLQQCTMNLVFGMSLIR